MASPPEPSRGGFFGILSVAGEGQSLLKPPSQDAKPSLLGTEALSSRQAHLDDRIRTLSLVICASAVLAAAVYYLQNILVRFVLALALQVPVHVAWSGLGLTLTLGGPKP